LQIDRVEGLAAVAQAAASSCIRGIARPARGRAGTPGVRPRSRPDIEFAEVIEAAKDMRQR